MGGKRRFGVGMMAGAAFTAVALTATTAYAGSGVGGVFNLGQTNTVNATTTLTGSKAGPMLAVTNTNTGTGTTGLSITVPANMPPLKVSSSRVAPNLNSDLVDGFSANGLTRVAHAESETIFGAYNSDAMVTATITIPKTGYVIAHARALLSDDFTARCGACYFHMYIHDDAADTYSQHAAGRIGIGSAGSDDAMLTNEWVFPVTAGTRSFSLHVAEVDTSGGPGEATNPLLILQFVPFDGTGAQITAATASASSSPSGSVTAPSGNRK